MKNTRDNLISFADVVLRIFARGICAVSTFDKRVAADVETLGDGFSFAVCAGMGANPPSVKLKTENGRFTRGDPDINGANVVIRFKDVSGVVPVLMGKMSVETAFAQHRMLICGNMNQAVMLVRIINITEAYLFPKFMIKDAMRSVPAKQAPRLFVYIFMLFFGAGTRQQAHPPKEAAAQTALDNGNNEAAQEVEAAK